MSKKNNGNSSRGLKKFRWKISVQLNRLNLTPAEKKAELKKATRCQRAGRKYVLPIHITKRPE
ncbi:hypothetical protein IID19_04595 [Patescibacteria group bacterium]|nr:hypothetical protein [Patescibacteria group bacterium]